MTSGDPDRPGLAREPGEGQERDHLSCVVDVARDREQPLTVQPALVLGILLPDVALELGPSVQPGPPQEDAEGEEVAEAELRPRLRR
eukprot:CAMPEP_0195122792 /NCGR_PEP_ID=MMETSP0448-20130528/127267_1 /TAXON_ID=66468 /ORGANISM="Heterocapsa triquestra, Strain CCMP 448" /LENGTH=86 /DNA_ID=CAMNT_0040160303 /DNA_START=97 /DNA_END=353 /DNA_ORIENTATION=-